MKSLRAKASFWIIMAMCVSALSTGVWMMSLANWDRYLHRSYMSGIYLYDALSADKRDVAGMSITTLSGPSATLAQANLFHKLPEVAASDYRTQFSLQSAFDGDAEPERISIAIISEDLQYPIAKIGKNTDSSIATKLADVTRLLATYCSQNILFMQYEKYEWVRVTGDEIWGCQAKPYDLRLPALAIATLTFFGLLAMIANMAGHFTTFSQMLSVRHHTRGDSLFETAGPTELHALITNLNNYLEIERQSLAKRAMFLSSVSHDLGTPATRLRLRTELIEDKSLQGKMEADITQMTHMIETVLAYTQTEMNAEQPRRLSLTSLVEAVVADFQDTGCPVTFAPDLRPARLARSIFLTSKKTMRKNDSQRPDATIITGQPLSLTRALTNLIENALKYGRKADVSIDATAQYAHINIDDHGKGISAQELEALTSPFTRGGNAKNVTGSGIGLAIASTIAEQHGGYIAFQETSNGIRATITIARS